MILNIGSGADSRVIASCILAGWSHETDHEFVLAVEGNLEDFLEVATQLGNRT